MELINIVKIAEKLSIDGTTGGTTSNCVERHVINQ